MTERIWCHEMIDPLLYNCPVFLSNFFDSSSTAFEISVCLLVCANADSGCFRFVVQNGRIPPPNGNLLLRFKRVEQQNQSVVANGTDWAVISHYLFWLLSRLSVHLPLGSTVPFGRPSASFENSFILSLRFTMPAVSLSVLSKVRIKKAFSLYAGALSLWHSQPQWVYGTVRVPRNLDSAFFQCPILHSFLSF